MKALTVEEYEWLQDEPGDVGCEPADAHSLAMGAMCLEAGYVRTVDLEPGRYTWVNTPHGDRAVRVHRAWSQSMGAG